MQLIQRVFASIHNTPDTLTECYGVSGSQEVLWIEASICKKCKGRDDKRIY